MSPVASKRFSAGVITFLFFATLWFIMGPSEGFELLKGEGRNETGETSGEKARRRRAESMRKEREEQSEPTAAEEAIELPPPVDFSKVDRERDLHGRVVDAQGQPIAGALIEARSRRWWRLPYIFFIADPDFIPIAETLSASDGSFRIPLRPGEPLDLSVIARGHARGWYDDFNPGERCEIALQPGADVVLDVKDKSGKALADLDLRIDVFDFVPPHTMRRADLRFGQSDSEGVWVVEGLREGNIHINSRRYGGWTQEYQVTVKAGKVNEISYVLRARRLATGVVLDASTGDAIEGAQLRAKEFGPDETKSGPDGRFVIEDLRSHSHAVFVHAEGYSNHRLLIKENEDLTFLLNPAAEVTGRVIDEDERPIAGVRVAGLGREKGPGGYDQIDDEVVYSDEEGRFSLTKLRAGIVHGVMLDALGYGQRIYDLPPGEAGLARDLGDIVLGRESGLRVLAIDSDGEPVARARVLVNGAPADRAQRLPEGMEEGSEEEVWRVARCDDLGRCYLANLAPGSYKVRVDTLHRPPIVKQLEIGPEPYEHKAVFAAGRRLEVQVVDGNGQGLNSDVTASWGIEGYISVTSDDEGRVVFESLPEGEIQLSCHLLRIRDFLPMAPTKVIADGRSVILRVDVLERLEGVVLDEGGRGIPGMKLTFTGIDRLSGRSGKDGRFSISAPSGRELELCAAGFGTDAEGEPCAFRGRTAGLAAPANGIRLTVAARPLDRSLELEVVDVEGGPLPGVVVGIAGQLQIGSQTSDAAGRLRFEGLPDEEMVFNAQPSAALFDLYPDRAFLRRASLNLRPGADRQRLVLSTGVWLEGVLLDAEGQAIEKGMIIARGPGKRFANDFSDAQGRFRMPVEAGHLWTLSISHGAGLERRAKTMTGVSPASGLVSAVLE